MSERLRAFRISIRFFGGLVASLGNLTQAISRNASDKENGEDE